MYNNLIELYAQLAAMTKPLCLEQCRAPRTCCSPEYCVMAKKIAKEEWNLDLKETSHHSLPLMGTEGCTAPPHVRPLCAAHVCDGTLMRQSAEFQQEYFDLRDKISVFEYEKDT